MPLGQFAPGSPVTLDFKELVLFGWFGVTERGLVTSDVQGVTGTARHSEGLGTGTSSVVHPIPKLK